VVTSYQTVWDDTVTGRVRSVDDPSPRPLAWFRITWSPTGHDILRLDIYGDGVLPGDRPWLNHTQSIQAAVEFVHQRRDALAMGRTQGALPDTVEEADDPWENASVVEAD